MVTYASPQIIHASNHPPVQLSILSTISALLPIFPALSGEEPCTKLNCPRSGYLHNSFQVSLAMLNRLKSRAAASSLSSYSFIINSNQIIRSSL